MKRRAWAKDKEESREQYAVNLAYTTVGRFKYCKTGDWDDLLGAALEGAAVALHKFQEGMGTKFSSYALCCIRGYILDELRFWDPLTRGERQKVRAGAPEPLKNLSLDTLVMDDADDVFGHDLLQSDEDVEEKAMDSVNRQRWLELLSKLPGREGQALYRRYYLGHSNVETSKVFGVGESRTLQIIQSGLEHLRPLAEASGLAPER